MRRSGDTVIGRSGDRKTKLTAETRSRGEKTSKHLTTEARRHGEESGDPGIGEAAYICHPERVGANATGSRRTTTKPSPGNTASGNSHEILKGLLRWFERAIQTFRAALREISDESAYDRFLLRTNACRSIVSYCEFTRERDAAMVKRPRCC
jgi:hypothetical protein